ncbi:helix-turn-helix domain-containing protein [Roseomonas harenae]|uniref:winged helix DNA-binding protein n=1 Tax=Muricoccus harenae TaxID=2692566 RepID=UPI00133143BD|nr:winged helix DNA-binding protein [Roseomonas harenae]
MNASLTSWDGGALADHPSGTKLASNTASGTDVDRAALLRELTLTCERLLQTVKLDAPGAPASPQRAEAAKVQPSLASLDAKNLASSLKRMQRLRARRRRMARGELFEWPAWDMLLDLAAVRAEGTHLSVSSVCISSGAPQSTALRKLAALERANLVQRYAHGTDGRRVCVALTDEALELVHKTIDEERAMYEEMAVAL